jgi:hypothetical protein
MVDPEQIQCARESVESGFQDAVTIGTPFFTEDDEGNRIPGVGSTAYQGLGRLQRMGSGDERVVASRLEGSAGFVLKVPHTVDPEQKGNATVNGEDYEILSGFGGEVRSTHTKFFLKRID